MVSSVSLIVLSLTKIKENAVVLHTLSPEFGRRSFLATVNRTAPMALFLPLSILNAEVVRNPRSDLWKLRNIRSEHPLNAIRSDLRKNTIALFMSEVLYRTVRDGSTADSLYSWCRGSILTLDSLESDFSNYHLRFLLELASVLGFTPSIEDLAPFVGENLAVARQLLELDLAGCMLLPLNGRTRNDLAASLIQYLCVHTESNINVQSLKVLSEIFR